jgi:hypothetical protein
MTVNNKTRPARRCSKLAQSDGPRLYTRPTILLQATLADGRNAVSVYNWHIYQHQAAAQPSTAAHSFPPSAARFQSAGARNVARSARRAFLCSLARTSSSERVLTAHNHETTPAERPAAPRSMRLSVSIARRAPTSHVRTRVNPIACLRKVARPSAASRQSVDTR